jgi:hypothetical protein
MKINPIHHSKMSTTPRILNSAKLSPLRSLFCEKELFSSAIDGAGFELLLLIEEWKSERLSDYVKKCIARNRLFFMFTARR